MYLQSSQCRLSSNLILETGLELQVILNVQTSEKRNSLGPVQELRWEWKGRKNDIFAIEMN